MRFVGRIELGKELSFTQAEQLRDFFGRQHTGKYYKACLRISPDGRALQWDGTDDKVRLEFVLADVINKFMKGWGINCTGVITATGTKTDQKYEIVVLKNLVKLIQDKHVFDIA